ncbi:MAG: hypothetical protein N2038_10415 [Geminicoccaceae bacterium]|nr:hypothetical protein [Geminicoccaceae bacterium]MCS7267602.1 hypothetical protein [Geminicoccaceae bacterium]MCX7630652.1 hypothetical protein [Geminicoccaceae bacterium]MDW8123160.1 hypothetical protein [Geminicoccaceae bacterium]MDW8340180.1 hypothetical protein [Geminicoccaceae bacterium]
MSLLLPLDDNGNPIAVLGFDYRGTQKLAVGPHSVRNPVPIPSDIEIVTLYATGPCRFELGDATVTADPETSPFLAPNQYVDVPLRPGERYVAFVAEAEPCSAYIIGRI